MLTFPDVNVNYVWILICIYLHTRKEYSRVTGCLIFIIIKNTRTLGEKILNLDDCNRSTIYMQCWAFTILDQTKEVAFR